MVNSGTERLTILHSLYLQVPAGQFVAVVGPSGSGKSTLLTLIAGLDKPTTGHIRLAGEWLPYLTENELARLRRTNVGFVFQSFHLVPSLTAYENVLVPMEMAGIPKAKARAKALLAEVGLNERGHHYPAQLSGGEQQRVAIARAFANNPPLLLADEPTGSLDAKNGALVFALLAKLNREHGTTLLFVTHDQELAEQADRVITLHEGRVIEDRLTDRGREREGEKGRVGEGEWGRRGVGEAVASHLPSSPAPLLPLSSTPLLPSIAPALKHSAKSGFTFKLAWRELRSSWQRLLLFFLCIAIGVGSIVGLRSLVQNLRKAVVSEVRTFFGADVRIGHNQPFSKESRASLERIINSPLVTANSEFFELQTMLRAANNSKARPLMVQLRAVQDSFPLYGEVKLKDNAIYSSALLKERGVLLPATLMQQLNLSIGDKVKIGKLVFTIRGVLEFLPGNEMQFGSVQRALTNYDDAMAAGLTGFGSRVNYGWLFKTPEGMDEALVRQLGYELRKSRPNYLASYRFQQSWMTRSLENNDSFLGLVGLAILVLGGIGIASVSRVFVQQKLKTIAILKCLGGENRHVLTAYLMQVLALSVVGSLLGLVLASGITHFATSYAKGRLPFALVPGLTWTASLQGIGIGVLITLLFALPPLLEIRVIKPLLLLRQDAGRRNKSDRLRLWAMAGSVAGLVALIGSLSSSWRQALIFVGWLVGTTIVLNFAGVVLMFLLRRLRRLPSFVLRQGIGSLYRPGNQTRVILFAVGLGALFIIAIRLQQAIVMREFNFELDGAAADVFMMDVQKEQREAAEATLARLSGNKPVLIPIVFGNIVDLKRVPGKATNLTSRDLANRLNWERRFSYRAQPEPHEEIIAGKFWDGTPSKEPEVSVEERYAQELELSLGDKLICEFQGQRLEATVTSIRRLERLRTPISFMTRFNVLFRPGTLEAIPQMFVGAVKGPAPGPERAHMLSDFVDLFPNVTIMDAFDTIAELRRRLGELSFVVSLIGGFVFVCGVLILIGSVAMTKYQRLYESAILKTLGAKKRLLIYIALVEYGIAGLLAGLIGSSAAIGLTWMFSKYTFNIPWRFVPAVNIAGVAITLLLVMLVGVLASWDVMMKKPNSILRDEAS